MISWNWPYSRRWRGDAGRWIGNVCIALSRSHVCEYNVPVLITNTVAKCWWWWTVVPVKMIRKWQRRAGSFL
jgi:hypothetical protein